MTTKSPLETTASQICRSPYAMVYGFDSCNYNEVNEGLRESALFKHIFNYTLGYERDDEAFAVKPPISQVQTSKQGTADTCKAALVNIVFENCKRMKARKPLIPVLFVIDRENNSRSLTSECITTKEASKNKIITFKEIRRAYKLCEEFDDPEIRAAAKGTFKFVKVHDDLSLKQIPAPWEKMDWKGFWDARKQTPKTSRKKPNWRLQLQKMKEKHVGRKPVISSSSSSSSSSETASILSPTSTLSPPSSLSPLSPTSALSPPTPLSPPSPTSPHSTIASSTISSTVSISTPTDGSEALYRRKTIAERSPIELRFLFR